MNFQMKNLSSPEPPLSLSMAFLDELDARLWDHGDHRHAMPDLFSLFQNSRENGVGGVLSGFASLLPFVTWKTQRNGGRNAQDHQGNHLQIAIEVCSRPKLLLEFFRCRRDQWKHKSPQAKTGVFQVSRVRSRSANWKSASSVWELPPQRRSRPQTHREGSVPP